MDKVGINWELIRSLANGAFIYALLGVVFLGFALSDAASEATGPAVAIVPFTGQLPELVVIPGISDLITNDFIENIGKCDGRVTELARRAEAIKEIELGQSKYGDPVTAPKPGEALQPDIFINGAINGDDSFFSWRIEAKSAEGGYVIAEDSGSDRIENLFNFTRGVADRLLKKICEERSGYTISGKMDDATINGTICGTLDKPFTANSPEVGGRWKFTPSSASAGMFSYSAASVGGVPGSGSGTYVIQRTQSGTEKIQLSGKGSIRSPSGTFSAAITEALTLTPVKTCGRKGNK